MQYISLIIPAKNEKESLEKTIREILNYKFINEIIIVVDGHQDNSIGISNGSSDSIFSYSSDSFK